MKPLIGVSPALEMDNKSYYVTKNNLLAIEKAGGIPVVLPYLSDSKTIAEVVEKIDGLYLTGGDDIDPIYFNEEPHPKLGTFQPERDAFEIEIIQKMLEKDKPILGVCKGAQMLNLATGGDMYQDIHSQIEGELVQHSQKAANYVPVHDVELTEGSLIHRLAGRKVIRVNSFHHQANRKPGKDLIISGLAKDGVVEVVESEVHQFALGLQWHPEHMSARSDDEVSNKIYSGFVAACRSDHS
ncbi:gamma-glutamyl-gamma-aminobutyrate hydrolase family protein [Oceanobacillus luteolus]|uniref:Gamma-glutamyl-gamma-aminobutyrate hydrolase family protein n=1 Tax=Oceanobacillus luteolus TaxID=1274358 RepID=A0ABW4HNA7_9BACI|nr:gamma-glutamyl-gamma-aminobutyrate hydrolase family protein [Oceanobacillus luteolus]MCM3742434.1 gamma-glutamyl-gamma-aminobutyrate hydrolase family protein [Oceanobacillus luteolus]